MPSALDINIAKDHFLIFSLEAFTFTPIKIKTIIRAFFWKSKAISRGYYYRRTSMYLKTFKFDWRSIYCSWFTVGLYDIKSGRTGRVIHAKPIKWTNRVNQLYMMIRLLNFLHLPEKKKEGGKWVIGCKKYTIYFYR